MEKKKRKRREQIFSYNVYTFTCFACNVSDEICERCRDAKKKGFPRLAFQNVMFNPTINQYFVTLTFEKVSEPADSKTVKLNASPK